MIFDFLMQQKLLTCPLLEQLLTDEECPFVQILFLFGLVGVILLKFRVDLAHFFEELTFALEVLKHILEDMSLVELLDATLIEALLSQES